MGMHKKPKKKMKSYGGGGSTGKIGKKIPKGGSYMKKGGSVGMKAVKAPTGFHWMKSGTSFKLMKNPAGGFKKLPGASLTANFKVQKVHKKK